MSRMRLLLAWLISWRRLPSSTNCWLMDPETPWFCWVVVSRPPMGCCCCCCWSGTGFGCVPDWMDSTANLKISKESGFSGVAAVIPKVFPAGRVAYILLGMEYRKASICALEAWGRLHVPCSSKSTPYRPQSLRRSSWSALDERQKDGPDSGMSSRNGRMPSCPRSCGACSLLCHH